MTIFLALIMFLFGALVCYLVIINHIGRKAPNSIKGKAYLKKRLSDVRVDISAISDTHIDEVVALAEIHAKAMTYSNPRDFLNVFVELLDYVVNYIYNAERNGLDVTTSLEMFLYNLKQDITAHK